LLRTYEISDALAMGYATPTPPAVRLVPAHLDPQSSRFIGSIW
jgi:hypothetical protein